MIGQILDKIRKYYLRRFSSAVELSLRDPHARVVTEAAFLDEHGSPEVEGLLELPLRGDLVVVRDGVVLESQVIDTEGMLSFDPVRFDWEKRIRVELCPFQWNWLEVTMDGSYDSESLSPLQRWYLDQFGDPQRTGDGHGFLHVVHFMSDPVWEPGACGTSTVFSLDLGSAPVTSVESLLDCIAGLGSPAVRLGTNNAANEEDSWQSGRGR